MTRPEKRQEKRAQEDKLKRKKFEAQGFTFSTQAYPEKRSIANRKRCEETWEETSRTTGKTTSNSTMYVWISGKEISKTNVETRCLKIGRYRWKIENNFLVMKHQGYRYEHCFSYDWNAMVGFHHLMQIGRFINVLLAHSELLEKKVTELGITGLLAFIYKACTADVLDLNRIATIVNDESYHWRLAS